MLFNCKTDAWFDVWSFEHIIAGICLAYFAKPVRRFFFKQENDSLKIEFILVILASYMWETLEHYLETGLFGNKISYWFHGIEFWGNRFIADSACIIIGYLLYNKFRVINIPARIFSIAWLYMHIFVFPHSMYIHTHYLHQTCKLPLELEVID